MVEVIQAETCWRRTPIRGYGRPMEQVLPAFQTPWVQAQLDRTPWRRGMYGRVYSHPPATGGIRLGGVVAGDVGDAIRIDDLRGIKIPYYDGNPSNLDDFILDWEDFAEEVVGEMREAPRDRWVCRTFPHRLAQDLKEELRDQIR